MGTIATRLRLFTQAQDVLLAVSITLFQFLGAHRLAYNQPAAWPWSTRPTWATCC